MNIFTILFLKTAKLVSLQISATMHFPVLIGPHAWFVIPLSAKGPEYVLRDTSQMLSN